ncbi:MAG: PadR family transcriptional regulator [Bauldia sp.]
MGLSSLEQHILLAVLRQAPGAYGVSIQDCLKEITGRAPSLGAIYAALERLQRRGFLESREGEPTATRGGRRKIYFEVSGAGRAALDSSIRTIEALSQGLREKLA